MNAPRLPGPPLFRLERSCPGADAGDFASCYRAVWGLMPDADRDPVRRRGPPAVWLVPHIPPGPGRERVVWGQFLPDARRLLFAWPQARAWPRAARLALVGHELAHAVLFGRRDGRWRDEGAVNALAESWGLDVDGLYQRIGARRPRAASWA
jgi:hypothetical protein